ncbi:MAG TPA: CHASE3 domain-containing protein [Verrucomicrobiae bacterium]|jgi:PAS domain S-box-containing protein|nr:CHASE3 domain-containing protein [Verrucomicrobiae bacterium]
MKNSIENKIAFCFAVSLVMLLAIGWLSYRTTTNLVATENWVSHTHEVIATLESGSAILTDAETSQRGYLLTGDEKFLQDSKNAQAQITDWSGKLWKLTTDNPEQQRRLTELNALISERLAVLNDRIKLRQEQGLQAAANAVALRLGKQAMDRVWGQITEMHTAESQLLVQRQQAVQTAAKNSLIIILSGTVLACAIGLVAAMMIRRDLRLRQQAQEELDRFFTLSLDFLCIASSDGYFKRVSPIVTEILGWSIEEFLARPFLDFVHPDDKASTLREVEEQIVSGKKTLNFENRYQHKDGSWRVLSWRSMPQPSGLMYATARDVTDQKRTEEKITGLNADLQIHTARLEAANKELEAFSYSVSHDLRAPLRHVDGFVDLLGKHAAEKLDDRSRRYLKIIGDSAHQMGVLIDDLLIFSRMSRTELRCSKVALDSLLSEAVNALQMETKGRQIVWKIGSLPEVEADAPMLRQVWANLIGNAVKYTRTRDPAEIEVGCRDSGNGEFVFFVRDNGVGFDMQYAHKLFGVFQRLHRSEDFEGTGIGLANVNRIVGRHGGRAWAEGKIGSGATFFFSLPKTKTETKT